MANCMLISWSDHNGGLHPIGWPKSDSGLHSAVHLSNLCVPILLLGKLICGLHFADGCYFSIYIFLFLNIVFDIRDDGDVHIHMP